MLHQGQLEIVEQLHSVFVTGTSSSTQAVSAGKAGFPSPFGSLTLSPVTRNTQGLFAFKSYAKPSSRATSPFSRLSTTRHLKQDERKKKPQHLAEAAGGVAAYCELSTNMTAVLQVECHGSSHDSEPNKSDACHQSDYLESNGFSSDRRILLLEDFSDWGTGQRVGPTVVDLNENQLSGVSAF